MHQDNSKASCHLKQLAVLVCHFNRNPVWSLDSRLVQGSFLACQLSRAAAVLLMVSSRSLQTLSGWLVKCPMVQCHRVVPILSPEALSPTTKLWLKCKRLSVEVDLVVADRCKECKECKECRACRATHSKCLGLLKVRAVATVDLSTPHNKVVAGWG